MAKQKVTLSLDSEIYQRTREALQGIPGKPSVSSLVDQLLDGFSTNVAPAVAALASGATTLEGAQLQMAESLFSDVIRIFDDEEEIEQQAKK